MRFIRKTLNRLWTDEQGGEVLEYAIVAGLVVVAAIGFITLVGGKVSTTWNNLNGAMP